MKRTILILLAILTMTPVALRAQENESLSHGWGFGFQVGVGGMLPTGSLSDDFKGCALFTGGLNAEYNLLRFKADVAYGQPSFKNEPIPHCWEWGFNWVIPSGARARYR